MNPKNKPVTIQIDTTLAGIISQLAEREQKSLSLIAAQLMAEALDQREDKALAKIADAIEIDEHTLIDHADAWK
jgi:hypothetical protein